MRTARKTVIAVLGCFVLLIPLASGFAADVPDPRVAEIRSRLSQTKAGQVLLRCLEAHGLEAYFKARVINVRVLRPHEGNFKKLYRVSTYGRVMVRFSGQADASTYQKAYFGNRYFPITDESILARNGQVSVELGTQDGENFWTVRDGVRSYDPGALRLARRVSLLSHFFSNLPFKFAEPHANLEFKGEQTLEGVTYEKVRIHWGNGIGETPDDWFVLYVNKRTGIFEKLHYIATGRQDKGIFISDWTEPVRVAGILFPTRRTMYRSDINGNYGPQSEQQQLSELRVETALNLSEFAAP